MVVVPAPAAEPPPPCGTVRQLLIAERTCGSPPMIDGVIPRAEVLRTIQLSQREVSFGREADVRRDPTGWPLGGRSGRRILKYKRLL